LSAAFSSSIFQLPFSDFHSSLRVPIRLFAELAKKQRRAVVLSSSDAGEKLGAHCSGTSAQIIWSSEIGMESA
jgi:hypothetical protein